MAGHAQYGSIPFNQSEIQWDAFIGLAAQQKQRGGGSGGFRGNPYQRGYGGFIGDPYQRGHGIFGGLLKGLARTILPIAKRVGKSVVREAVQTGMAVASDVADGKNIGKAVKERGRTAAQNILHKTDRWASKQMQPRKGKKGRKGKRQKGGGLPGAFSSKAKGVSTIKGQRGGKKASLKGKDILGNYII